MWVNRGEFPELSMSCLKSLYKWIGIHTAPPGTLCHDLHRLVLALSRFRTRHACPPPKDVQDVLVAFRISGGIGDHLIAARYIRDLLATVGDFKFDIYSFSPGSGPVDFFAVQGIP